MSENKKIRWALITWGIKRIIQGLSVFFFFFAVITLFVEGKEHKSAAVVVMICGFIFGYFFGNYVAGLFLRQEKKTQTRILILLPILSFICMLITVNILSNGMRYITPLKVVILIIAAMLFVFPAGTFLSLMYHRLKKEIRVALTSAAHSQSELQLLQSQLSPHFLFNTLNNLYGISISQPEKTPGMLLKLSELLRYSVYEAKDTFVPLKDEIAYLKNYIEFEKIRIGDRLDLRLDLEDVNSDNISIAPMLLVVFVENAFKHAKNNLSDKIRIEIGMKLWSNSILFAVNNSHKDIPVNGSEINKHGGFGLQSAIKRLELLYPNAHDLKIEKQENTFSVMLRVNEKRLSK